MSAGHAESERWGTGLAERGALAGCGAAVVAVAGGCLGCGRGWCMVVLLRTQDFGTASRLGHPSRKLFNPAQQLIRSDQEENCAERVWGGLCRGCGLAVGCRGVACRWQSRREPGSCGVEEVALMGERAGAGPEPTASREAARLTRALAEERARVGPLGIWYDWHREWLEVMAEVAHRWGAPEPGRWVDTAGASGGRQDAQTTAPR